MSLESIQEPIVGNCGSSSVAHLPLIRQLVTHLIAHYNGTQKEPADLAEKLLQVLNSPQEAHRQFLKWLCPLQDGEFFSEEVLKEWADHAECREALRKGLRQLAGSPSKESPQQVLLHLLQAKVLENSLFHLLISGMADQVLKRFQIAQF
jgi:hypothetical protein